MSKQADKKKSLFTKVGEEITSGGITVIITPAKEKTEKKEK